jgi:hypothetical protein
VNTVRDILLSGDVGAAVASDGGDSEFVGFSGGSASDQLGTGKTHTPAVLIDDHPARDLLLTCLCRLLAAEMADVQEGDVSAFGSSVTNDMLTALSSEMSVPAVGGGGAYSRIRRRISRIGGKFKRGVARLSQAVDGPSAAAAPSAGGQLSAAETALEVDAAVARAVAVLDVLLRVVCFVDHPLLTLAAGEVLVDHYSRDGGFGQSKSSSSMTSLGMATPASGSPAVSSGRSAVDDTLKAELVVALSNIAVLSSQVCDPVLDYRGLPGLPVPLPVSHQLCQSSVGCHLSNFCLVPYVVPSDGRVQPCV